METKPEVELATLKSELHSVAKSLDEVKATLHEMNNFGKLLTQITADLRVYGEKFGEVDGRLDTLESRQTSNTAFLNKIRGSVTTSAWVARAIQAFLIAGVGWLYTSMVDTREKMIDVQHQVQFLQRENQQILQEIAKRALERDK